MGAFFAYKSANLFCACIGLHFLFMWGGSPAAALPKSAFRILNDLFPDSQREPPHMNARTQHQGGWGHGSITEDNWV
jgi:hypothetical protein